jgi:hypothetical protein
MEWQKMQVLSSNPSATKKKKKEEKRKEMRNGNIVIHPKNRH